MAGEAETGKETQIQETGEILEDLKGPEDEGSLASIIEQSRHQVLTEHPTAGGMGAFEPKPPEEEKEEETPLPEEIPPETEDGKPSAEAKPPETEFKPKHQTWEETEKARIEAEQKMHAATEEAANLRKELEKGAEKETPEPPEPSAEAPKPVTKEERKERVKTALATIRNLDEADPDYDEKVAEAWAEAGVGGSEAPFPSKDEIAKLAAQQVREELKAEDETKRQKDEEVAQEKADANARTKAEELATGAGLNMEKGTVDHRLFWDVAREIPEDQKSKPFPEQVQWAVGEVRRLKGEIVQGKPGADGRELQRQNAVLERGATQTTRTKKPAESEGYTLGGIINNQMNQRRI